MRALSTTLDEAKRLGAMALFNEKYGDVVRMVEVGDGSFSRELCGGTHVRGTAEMGLFRILVETSSAANVRRIEAITGPEAVSFMRARDTTLGEAAERCASRASGCPRRSSSELRVRELRELERRPAAGERQRRRSTSMSWSPAPATCGGVSVLVAAVEVPDADALLQLVDRLKGKLGDAAIVLGSPGEGPGRPGGQRRAGAGRARACAPARSSRSPPREVGGGGGGRDTLARAGGRDPGQLPAAIERRACGDRSGAGRGETRCGCSRSITAARGAAAPSATRPGCWRRRWSRCWPRPRGAALGRLRALVAELGAERVVVGLPLSLSGADSAQTRETRAFAATAGAALPVPVELYDERFTTRLAERSGGRASEDSRAAAHLLESWLARHQAAEVASG